MGRKIERWNRKQDWERMNHGGGDNIEKNNKGIQEETQTHKRVSLRLRLPFRMCVL